mmetsp:Transcript_88915/g.247009  ORF Transcript_88915/g.247009 Transcript_88915/m.247009 type:complete len:712 (-) Transcript_88915:818-2953(-)
MEEPELHVLATCKTKSLCNGACDMVQVPPEVHLELLLSLRLELRRAERQRGVLGPFLLLRRALLLRVLRRGGRPRRPPAAVGYDAVDAERLARVVQRHHDVNGVCQVCREVRHRAHRVRGCGLAGSALLACCGWWGRRGLRRGLTLAFRGGELPDDDVARPELLVLHRALHAARLQISLAELLPALPGGAVHVLRQRRHLLAVDVRPELLRHPAVGDHLQQRVAVLHVVSAEGHDAPVLRAEVLGHEQRGLLVLPAPELVGLGTVLGRLPLQRLGVVATGRHAEHHQVRVAGVEVRRAELRDMRAQRAVGGHEGKAHLPGVVPVMQREDGEVRTWDLCELLHLGREVLDHLVPAHLEALPQGDLRVVPEARHFAEVSVEDEAYPDLQLLLHLLAPPLLSQPDLTVAPLDHAAVCAQRIGQPQDLSHRVLPDIHQHVGIVDPWPHGRLCDAQLPWGPVEVAPDSEVAAPVIVLHRGKLTAGRYCLVVKLEPAVLQVWPNMRVVVPAIYIATVHHNGVEKIGPCPGREWTQVQASVEFEARVQLHHVHLLEVEMKALELQVQNRWEGEETDPLLGTLLSMALCFVRVVALQRLLSCELSQRLLNGPQLLAPLALDVQLYVVESLVAAGLVVHIDALDVVLHLALEEPFDGTVHGCALHLLFQPIAQDPVELLRVVLGEGIHGVPTKGLHELAAVDRLIGRLQPVENVLESHDE